MNLQFIQKVTPSFDGPETFATPFLQEVARKNQLYHRQRDSRVDAISARIEYKLLQETLKLELTGLYYIADQDFLIRPKVTYAINDAVTGIVGAEIYHGADGSLFGQLKDYSSAYLELKYSF